MNGTWQKVRAECPCNMVIDERKMDNKVGVTRASNQLDDNEDDIEDYEQYKAARLRMREQQLHPPETSTSAETPFTKDQQDDQKPPGKPSQHAVAAPAVVMSRSTLDDDKQFIPQENLHLNLHLQYAEANKDGHDKSDNVCVASRAGATAVCKSSSTAAALTTGKSKNHQGESTTTDGLQSRQPGVQFIRRLAPGLTFDSVMIRQARDRLHTPSNQPSTTTPTATDTDTSTATVVAVEQSQFGSASGKKCNRKVIIAAAVISLCVVIAIVLGVVLGTSNRHDSNNNTLGGTTAPQTTVTTSFDPFTQNCDILPSQSNPHVITQCHCTGTISKLAPDITNQYNVLTTTFVSSVDPSFNQTLKSCSPQNQALVWLASGDGLPDGWPAKISTMRQRYGLALLFILWNGISWNVNTEWLSSAGECTWYGVKCATSEESVTDLVLSSNNVVGQIPGDVSRLANLTNLALDGNDLSNGTIPSEIGLLTNLQNLVLSSSNISGSIPTELYKLGHVLEIFQVDNNRMAGTLSTLVGELIQLGE
jgi:hypothetical protein